VRTEDRWVEILGERGESGCGENNSETTCSAKTGNELVAEQLLASWEGLFTVTLVIIHCNNLTVIVLNIYKAAAVLSALMKVCTIPCHDISH